MIPGKVSFTVDLRHGNDEGLLAMDAALRLAADQLQKDFPVQVALEQVVYFEPVAFAPALVDAIREGAERAGCSHLDIVSGAGHDAVYVAGTAPTAMIFVPCKDGISHNEIEDADPNTCRRCQRVAACNAGPGGRGELSSTITGVRQNETGSPANECRAPRSSCAAASPVSLDGDPLRHRDEAAVAAGGPSSDSPSGAPLRRASGIDSCGKPLSPARHSSLMALLR